MAAGGQVGDIMSRTLCALCFILATDVCCGQSSTLTVSITQGLAAVGENVSVVCRVSPAGPAVFVELHKVVYADDSSEYSEKIATVNVLDDTYKKTGRYSISVERIGDTNLYIMAIQNVQKEDSGYFACEMPRDETLAYTRLDVYQPVESIEFVNHTQTDVVWYQENQGILLTCLVRGALPLPQITVTAGGHDITSHFRIDKRLNVLCPYQSSSETSKQCLMSMDYDVAITTDSYAPDYQLDEGRITCTAEVPGATFPKAQTSFDVQVRYSPKIIEDECPSVIRTYLRTKNFLVSCSVRANPLPGEPTWLFVHRGDDVTIKGGRSGVGDTAGYTAIYSDLDEKVYAITLQISEITLDSFTNYTFFVSNNVGDLSRTISLEREFTAQELNIAAPVQSSILLVICTAILSLLISTRLTYTS